jgi:hypothetical protein
MLHTTDMFLAFAMNGKHTECVEDGPMTTYHARQPVWKYETYHYRDRLAYTCTTFQYLHLANTTYVLKSSNTQCHHKEQNQQLCKQHKLYPKVEYNENRYMQLVPMQKFKQFRFPRFPL